MRTGAILEFVLSGLIRSFQRSKIKVKSDFRLIARRFLEHKQRTMSCGTFRLVEHKLSLAEQSQLGRKQDFLQQR